MALSTKATPEALLIDLDGVIRVFDPDAAASAERDFGLPSGALLASAMAVTRLRPAILGEDSHEAWMDSVVADLADSAGSVERARAAVTRWSAHRGTVTTELLDFIRAVRARGVPVGLATNATDWLDADLNLLGLADEFDVVINSSVIGVHKPAGEFFRLACHALGVAPTRCLFVDDEDRNVRGARAAGLSAHRFTSPADLPYLTAALLPT